MIAELLNIPVQDRAEFKRWSDDLISGEGIAESYGVMEEYFEQIVEQRRKAPGHDIISALLEAQIDEQHLSLPELVSFCILLLLAGNATTTHLIGNAILCFDEYPQVVE